jgi:uncharacterized protein (TIGR00266 family)
MSQWYLSYDGNQVGPLDKAQAMAKAQKNPNGHAWREGFAEWLPISQVAELSSSGVFVPEPPSFKGASADEIDFKIFGSEMQFVEVETLFGDASGSGRGGGFMDKLLGAGKRLLTGESLFMTVFTHTGKGKAHVAFGAPYPGNIIPIPLTSVGGCLICQKDSFLCAAKGVSIGIHFQKKILTGLFGGEGFIMQKLEGNGMVFVHAGGTVVDRKLQSGEVLHVDTGCIVAMEKSVRFEIQQAGNIKTALFGGEGLFFATLHGPGKIWLQSLPFSRLAGRMLQASPERGGGKGEGSVLGPLGNLFGD